MFSVQYLIVKFSCDSGGLVCSLVSLHLVSLESSQRATQCRLQWDCSVPHLKQYTKPKTQRTEIDRERVLIRECICCWKKDG